MEVCYRCGRRLYSVERCPRCGLTFCEEHLPPEKHDCLAMAEDEGRKRARLYGVIEVGVFLLVLAVVWWLVNRA